MKKRFHRDIIYTKTPLKTNFRYKDVFQIFPCDYAHAPQSKYVKDFPVIIEYWTNEEENPLVPEDFEELKDNISGMMNQHSKLEKIIRLLSSITNHRFFRYDGPKITWGISIPEDMKTDFDADSTAVFNLYKYKGMAKDLEIVDFSERRHETAKIIGHETYYMNDPVESRTKEIIFPHTIHFILDKYFQLDEASQKISNTIAHLICNGLDIEKKMKSISFITFVSAIETLVNYHYKETNKLIKYECRDCRTVSDSPIICKKCNTPIWGVKVKFKEFLISHVSKTENSIKKYNRIYDLRSNIVHNGALLLGDENMDWKKSDKLDNEYQTFMDTKQLARLSLVHWLLKRPETTALLKGA